LILNIFNKFIIFQSLILFSNLFANHFILVLLKLTDYDIRLSIIQRKTNVMFREFAWFQKVPIGIVTVISFKKKNYVIIEIRELALCLLFWISLTVSDCLFQSYLFGFQCCGLFLELYNYTMCSIRFLFESLVLF